MGGILTQSSAHPLGEGHYVGAVPLVEAQAAEVLALRVSCVALQARRDLTPVDAEGRERFAPRPRRRSLGPLSRAQNH
jgi:hypothetical protein